MNAWIIAAVVLVAAVAPLGWLAFRGSTADGVVAVELAGVIMALALLLLAKGLESPAFGDLAIVLAICSLVGSLTFVRFLELGESEESDG